MTGEPTASKRIYNSGVFEALKAGLLVFKFQCDSAQNKPSSSPQAHLRAQRPNQSDKLPPHQMSKLTPGIPHFYSCTIFLLLLTFSFHAASQSHDQEQSILLKLKQHWQSPPSISHWTPSNTSHCTWPEITCTNGSVTGISLPDKNITETIPPFICDLKNLTVLDFSSNHIPGNFPTVLYNCSNLQYLNLSQNYFVGTIPDDVDRLARLQYLSLGYNNFSGDIPKAIGRFPSLRNLSLVGNLFNGSFPREIGNLSNLEVLELAYNPFVPSVIPENFTRLKKLKWLWMTESKLIGGIPEMIGDMAALELLDLSSNSLSGKIPDSLFQLKNLTTLYLYRNGLSSEIPRVVSALNLEEIDLSQNNLTGTIPDDFGNLPKLSGLALMFNQLSGEIPPSLGRIPTLIDIRLFSNNLSGELPPDLGRYSKLIRFEVPSNRLTGRLPEYLCSGGELLSVVAFDNNLTGELPESLGNCSSLILVMVNNNGFSGNIPSGLWSSLNLSNLMLNDNSFTGELPNKLAWNLLRLEISNNKFSGKIPAGISSWRNLIVFNASNNLLSGQVPSELTALPYLTTLLLDGNQLSGPLPSDIISWKSLTILNLSRNQLSGQIPEEIGFLPGLNSLDLSENEFSGQIPSQIGLLRLSFLNFSYNQLTGRIPSEFENTAFDSSFLNNPGLCASKSLPGLEVCDFETKKSSKVSTRLLAAIFSIVGVVIVLALLFAVALIKAYGGRKHIFNSTWKLTPFRRLNFTQSSILGRLTENNMIGSGGSGKVYRVAVNHSGESVAVKKIWNNKKLDHKLEKEFLAEVEILGTIRHSNIVKLMCCISSESSKLLVYEYLENHSLDRWLHKGNRPPTMSSSVVLDWPKRLQIAVGAARGLCYMHHDCSPPVVHRDVKSSNILLDSEFNAKIADFGLAKILMKQGEANTVSAVAGSFGYIAPEYAHTTRVSEKIDVYSFGVVLLELATGREANHGDEHTSLAEWARRHVQEDNPIIDALDNGIKDSCYLDEMVTVFKLGIFCTGTLPSTRPCMKEVLQCLLRCSQPMAYGIKNARSEYDGAPLLKNSRRERMSESDGGFASIV